MNFKIGWAKITNVGNATANWFKQQIEYRGKVSNCQIVYPYGYHAHAKIDESMVLLFGVNTPDNKAGIPFHPNVRPELKPGEVAVYQPGSNTIIKFDEEGNIIINTDVNITLTCADLVATAKNITATAETQVTVTAPNVTLEGDVTITGDLTVEGDSHLKGNNQLGTGGPAIARVGDSVSGGVITSGSGSNTAS